MTPTPGTRLDKDYSAPKPGTDLRNPPRPASQGLEPKLEVALVIETSDSNPDWRELIFTVHQVSFNDAFPLRKVICYFSIFMKEL
jgi:hypothetical protein